MLKRPPFFLLSLMLCTLGSGASAAHAQAAGEEAPAVAALAQAAPAQDQSSLTRGMKQFDQGNYEEALDAFNDARAKDPNSALAAYYVGATLKKMQLFEKAIPHLLASVTLQPPVPQGFLALADAYFLTDRLDEALHTLEVAERERYEPGQVEFLRGLVFLEKRNYSRAVESFEKAKAADQKLALTADFQLATINQRLGKLAEARDLFQSVADRSPDSDSGRMAKQQAEALAARLKKKGAFSAAVNGQYQYDSNVMLKPDDELTASNISGSSDTAVVLSLRAEYAQDFTPPYSLKFLYNGYMNAHQKLTTYDVQTHTLGVTPGYRMGENAATLPVMFTYTLVDNMKYLQALGVTPTFSFITGKEHHAVATVKVQIKDYLSDPVSPAEDRDSADFGAGFSWFRLIAEQKGLFSLKYELNKEKAVGENWSYLGNKIGAGAFYPLTDDVKLGLGLELYNQAFDSTNTIFGLKRTDTSYMGSAQCLYTLTQEVDAQAQYVYSKADSTISVYAYQKHIISIGLSARF